MRTVLSVEPVTGMGGPGATRQIRVFVERAPVNVPAKDRFAQLDFAVGQLSDWSAPDAVLQRGRMLRQLLEQHTGVAQILNQLWMVPAGQVRPIFIKLDEGETELITWETLCGANDEFVALDPRWPIGRITDPLNAPPLPPAMLRLPLRVLAIISAHGVRGQLEEWKVLRDACRNARNQGLDLRLRVQTGDAAMRQAIDAERQAGLPWVSTSHVESNGERVLQEVQNFRPHVLHFFCHGHVKAAGQLLELATGDDYNDPSATEGSVRIPAKSLANASRSLADPLVLVLNCCSGGAAVEEVMSMTHQAVSAGFRAGVAMLEPIEAADAHEFTRAFYPPLLAELHRAAKGLEKSPTAVPFEWATVMCAARTALSARHHDAPERNHEWALPLLYVRGMDPMHFMRADVSISEDESADYRLQVTRFAQWLREAGRSAPETTRREVMEEVLADVPRRFWPSQDGSFDDA